MGVTPHIQLWVFMLEVGLLVEVERLLAGLGLKLTLKFRPGLRLGSECRLGLKFFVEGGG